MPAATASQTIGPYWHLLEDKAWADLTRFGAEGPRLVLTGVVFDGDGVPVTDACVEIWQADPPASESFPAFGRAATDRDGRFRFVTLRPGPVPGTGNAQQAPHLALTVLARGLVRALHTRVYFAGEPLNDTDPLLCAIEDARRRETLIARQEADGRWALDLRLQGNHETVFLEV